MSQTSLWLATLSGGALGFLVKAGWQRWFSERTLSTEAILEKKYPSTYGYQRLHAEADGALRRWKGHLRPPEDRPQPPSWPDRDASVFLHPPISSDTGCPGGPVLDPRTPLFVRLEGRELGDGLIAELRYRFSRIPHDELERRLLQRREFKPEDRPRLWAFAPAVPFRSAQEVTALLEGLLGEARLWIRELHLIVELHLAEDLVEELIGQRGEDLFLGRGAENGLDEVHELTALSPGARYAVARNSASRLMPKGAIVGNLDVPRKYEQPIPPDVLNARLGTYFPREDRHPAMWSLLTLVGPPGSGKTELAQLLLETLVSEARLLAIIVSGPDLLQHFSTLALCKTRDAALSAIIKAIFEHPEQAALPNNFAEDADSRRAFLDVLVSALSREEQAAAIVIDDLHVYGDVRAAVSELCARPEWNLRLIAIGRSIQLREGLVEPEMRRAIRVGLWPKAQAQSMLETWVPIQHLSAVTSLLATGWLANQDHFSLYILRMVAEYVDELNRQPSELLEKAVGEHVKHVAALLERQALPPGAVLQSIRSMLEEGLPADEILPILNTPLRLDAVRLVGLLSWRSRFSPQEGQEGRGILDPQTVVDFSEGLVSDRDAAAKVLQAGSDAGIFDYPRGSATWRDALVADGCAALYLRTEVYEAPTTSIASMLKELERTGSLDILSLALDAPVILRLVEAVAEDNPRLASVVPLLVTRPLVASLTGHPELIDTFVATLIRLGCRAPEANVADIATGLSRLLEQSTELGHWCKEQVGRGVGPEARLALAIRALELGPGELYFHTVAGGAAGELHATEMAAFVWNEDGVETLSKRLVDLGCRPHQPCRLDRLDAIWANWCTRQPGEAVLGAISILGEACQRDGKEREPCYAQLAGCALRNLVQLRRGWLRTEIAGLQNRLDELRGLTARQARGDRRMLAGALAHWIAFYFCPEIIERDIGWTVDPKGAFAIPLKAQKGQPFHEILARVRSCGSFAVAVVDLPSAEELQAMISADGADMVMDGDGTHREVVRDCLPRGYLQGGGPILPSAICTWDGSSLEGGRPALRHFEREDVTNLVVRWRPRIAL